MIQLTLTSYFADREISVRRESVKDPSQDTAVLTELSYASLNKVSRYQVLIQQEMKHFEKFIGVFQAVMYAMVYAVILLE